MTLDEQNIRLTRLKCLKLALETYGYASNWNATDQKSEDKFADPEFITKTAQKFTDFILGSDFNYGEKKQEQEYNQAKQAFKCCGGKGKLGDKSKLDPQEEEATRNAFNAYFDELDRAFSRVFGSLECGKKRN